jgi:lipoyl-dependent peroxiredoxin
MSKHYASAKWEGNLIKGKGTYELPTSKHTGNLSFPSRFENDKSASSPEELIGAAHAACFSMALSHALDQKGFQPHNVDTKAEVTLDKKGAGFAITEILLQTSARVGGIDNDKFQEVAEDAKKNCPVSQALTGVNIRLEAKLI